LKESVIGLTRSGTQEDVSSIAENVFNNEASESFKRIGVERGMGVYTMVSAL
jgi:hypothetical protein